MIDGCEGEREDELQSSEAAGREEIGGCASNSDEHLHDMCVPQLATFSIATRFLATSPDYC